MNKNNSKEKKEFFEVFDVAPDKNEEMLKEICIYLLNDQIYLNKRYPLITFKDELWNEDPFNDRSWRYQLHSLFMVEYLLDYYEKSREIKYLEKALYFVENWKNNNFKYSSSDMAWHDHSTALRLIIIGRLYENLKHTEFFNDNINEEFLELAKFHCEKLLDENFYMKKHNHGMDQDIALFVASTIFREIKDAEKWKKVALDRLWIQLESIFAPDGSYLEHSPQYSFLLCERLFKFLEFLKKYGKENSYNVLEKQLINQMDFLLYLLQPDGYIPPIGDSDSQVLNYKNWNNPPDKELSFLKYIIHSGKKGTKPQFQIDKVFPIGGYASLRNKWEYDKDTVHLLFYSSFHSRVHKHHDDLSLTLFGHGMPILIDAGKYNYNYNSSERKFVESIYGHNSVAVDGENTETVRLNIGKSGLTDYYLGNEISLVSGIHCLYKGVIHRRFILYLKPYEIIVIDNLEGYKEHKFEQLFNLSPQVDLNVNKFRIDGKYEEKNIISIKPLDFEDSLELELLKGEKNPYRGWHSPDLNTLIPNYLVNYKQFGKSAKYATYINLNPDNENVTSFSWIKDLIDINWNGKEISIILGQEQNFISVDGFFKKTIPIPQPKIKEAIKEAYQFEYREKFRDERSRRIRYQDQLEKIMRK